MNAALPSMIPPGVVTQEFRTPETVRRGIVAGVVGNMLEWYDFALFGFFAHYATSGQRDFSSVSNLVAGRYELTVPTDQAQRARELLGGVR